MKPDSSQTFQCSGLAKDFAFAKTLAGDQLHNILLLISDEMYC
jgi:hypothetical protein